VKCFIIYAISTVYLLGDLNIDWFSSRFKLEPVPGTWFKLSVNIPGYLQTASIDHNYTNAAEICSKAVTTSIGCSDHNILDISRKNNVLMAGFNIVYTRSYKSFCSDSHVEDVKNICWSVIRSN
jgi:hypothetical protein